MSPPNWRDAQELTRELEGAGWSSPDCYSRAFGSVVDGPALYLFLLYDRETYERAFVAYVGMSRSLSQRLSGHEVLSELQATGRWSQRWFRPTTFDRLRGDERAEIHRFDPPWNIIGRRRGVAA